MKTCFPALTLAALLLTSAACSDDTSTPPDAARSDSVALDHGAPLDGPTADSGGSDTLTPDAAQPDANTPDAAQPDAGDPKCSGVVCNLRDDCCDCAAWDNTGPSPPPCSVTNCKQSTCSAAGLAQPQAYCHQGHCVVADVGTSCTSDADCQLVDDCCLCTAWPAKATPPACPKMCLIDTCASWQLAAVKARCVAGSCRLGL